MATALISSTRRLANFLLFLLFPFLDYTSVRFIGGLFYIISINLSIVF